jgi:hypothetical protein
MRTWYRTGRLRLQPATAKWLINLQPLDHLYHLTCMQNRSENHLELAHAHALLRQCQNFDPMSQNSRAKIFFLPPPKTNCRGITCAPEHFALR